MAMAHSSGSSLMYGRANKSGRAGDDTPDILIPPLAASSSQGNRYSNGSGGRESGSESSDARWYQPSFWKGSKQTHTMQAIHAGPATYSAKFDNVYNMSYPSRGKCLIFNHSIFEKSQNLAQRVGTEVDVQAITSTFSKFGFSVHEYQNLKYNEIMTYLKAIANDDHSQNDCLAVFVLTHGQTNQLHAHDILYKPSELWSGFTADKCSTLAGKPKMFFIQACRGDLYDDGTELKYKRPRTQVDGPSKDENSYRIPNQADFLTVFSSVEASTEKFDFLRFTMQYLSLGYFSWRNSRSGSVFIQALCKVLVNHHDSKDVLSMMTLVNREVALLYESRSRNSSENEKKQTPHVCHTLMRDIYLGQKFQSTLV